MSSKPRFFLLDAGPVIELHRLGLWTQVASVAEILVPSIVAEKEVAFIPVEDGVGKPIDISASYQTTNVRIIEGELSAAAVALSKLTPDIRERVDPGELEAIAILTNWSGEPFPEFCTADRIATTALCLLGHSDSIVSLEDLLSRVGLTRTLHYRFSSKAMAKWLDEGRRKYIQGEGLEV